MELLMLLLLPPSLLASGLEERQEREDALLLLLLLMLPLQQPRKKKKRREGEARTERKSCEVEKVNFFFVLGRSGSHNFQRASQSSSSSLAERALCLSLPLLFAPQSAPLPTTKR